MTTRTIDFLSSFGIMLAGVAVLLFGSVFFTHAEVAPRVARLPLSEERIIHTNGEVRVVMFPVSRPAVPTLREPKVGAIALTASSAVVIDDETNTVLYNKNDTDVRSLASITKLMSALVLSDLPINWRQTTFVTGTDIAEDHHLQIGEKYTLNDLWHIALVGSSNSAIKALVRVSGLSESGFAMLMNRKAHELGLYSMHFVEPTGLDSRNMGTAVDTARLLKEALAVDRIKQTLAVSQYDARPLNKKDSRKVWSTDWLMTNWIPNTFDSIIGKTGYITDSGYNFVVRLAGNKIHPLRVVVFGAATNENRFSEARDIATWVLDNYVWPRDQVATVAE